MDIDAAISIVQNLPGAVYDGISNSCPLIESEIQRKFDAGTDPYGSPWADLAQYTLDTGRHPPPLTDTGEMRSEITATLGGSPDAPVVTVSSPDEKSSYHQYGTRKIPARPILPEIGLPDTWFEAIRQEVEIAVDDAVAGRK